jgi:hypothetical protein
MLLESISKKVGVSQDQIFEISRQARIELARRAAKRGDVLEWGKYLFPDKFPLPFCSELHGYFVEVMEEEFTDTEAPRNHAKTTIRCFLIPLFLALNKPKLFRHYLNVQATLLKGMSVNTSIKEEIERNEELRELYGDMTGDKWNEQQFILKNGVIFTTIGAGQSIRGINYRNVRPDYIIVDDLYDEEDINNPDSTLKKNAWFWGSLYPARAKSRRCSIHVQGTAINGEDLLEALKKNARWKSRTFRAVKDWETKDVLWPELNTFESLMADKYDMGTVIFERELQNERRDETSAIVKSSWLKDWEYDPEKLKFDEHHFMEELLLGCDPSIGQKSENDYTGISLVIKAGWDDGDGNVYYIKALWNEHLSMDARVLLLKEINQEHPELSQANIEGIAGFKDFVAEVRRRTNVPVNEVDSVKDKISTLENKSHFFENKKVKINKNIDPKLKDMLKYQLTTNHPKHDDLRDSVLLTLDADSGPMVTVIR